MSYEQSFLQNCDAEGNAPDWAIEQIFQEHGQSYAAYVETLEWNQSMFDAKLILNHLGYGVPRDEEEWED
jgi:hypothetical protein